MKRKLLCVLTLLVWSVFALGSANTALADEFYKGKSIQLIVGYPPGGGYDTYTRAIARHLAKHIPGNPTVIVKSMPGSASLVSAHYLYDAQPDGLTAGVWDNSLILQQALGSKAIRFDAQKFGWVGAPSKSINTCVVMGFTGLRNLTDVLNSKKPLRMGATMTGVTVDMPKILNQTLGTNFKVITGKKGTGGIRDAMQKREIDGSCWGWEVMKGSARGMLDAKGDDKMIPFLIQGKDNAPEVKGLPQITDVIKDTRKLAMFRVWDSPSEFIRAMSVPPGTPKDRLEILRQAYAATLKDPAFLADAKKSKLAIDYTSGEEIEKHVAEIVGMSAEVKEDLKFLLPKK
jgi:tripartite-type tricarboxylate transporter receptor subunit TctC